MNTPAFDQLQRKFFRGLGWNGFFYFIYKILSTSLSFVLYSMLNTQDFSFWANINSLVFLTLLWIDFGFRKSLPRYCPEFAHSPKALRSFIKSVIIFQASVIAAIMPCFMLLQNWVYPSATNRVLYWGGALLLASEGAIALLRLIFHSHFFIKQFTLLTTTILFIEMTINYIFIMAGTKGIQLVTSIIATKIIMGCIAIVAASLVLRNLYKKHPHPNVHPKIVDYRKRSHEFIQHSAMMWATNVLKSLTERNFMIPLLTIVFGPSQANVFKVANDGALLFQRTVIKTIGITDTALLSHVQQLAQAKKLMPIAFTKIMTGLVALCLPLSGILLFAVVFHHKVFGDELVFQLFFILVIGYLIESILSPYERILEVKRRYSKLLIAYSPYLMMLLIALYLNLLTLIGLVAFMLVVQGVRLVSSFLMIPYASREFLLPFPLKLTVTIFKICLPIWLFLFLILNLF